MTDSDETNGFTSGINRRAILKAGAIGVGASIGLAGTASAHPEGWESMSLKQQLKAVRKATKQYRRLEVAGEDGYLSITPLLCGQGFHFGNFALITDGAEEGTGEAHPLFPEVLVYVLGEGNTLHLAAVEYLVPRAGPYENTPPKLFDSGDEVWAPLDESGLPPLWALHLWVHDESSDEVFTHHHPDYEDMPGCFSEVD